MALPLKWMPAFSFGGLFARPAPAFVTIHSTESDNTPALAEALAGPNWFGGPKAGTSTHKIVDVDSICEGVKRDRVAYHAGAGGNTWGVAYEFCGRAGWSWAKWREPAQLAMLRNAAPHIADDLIALTGSVAAARAAARWLSVVQVARREHGLCTHNDVRLAFPGTTSHSDPGPNFPYAELLGYVIADLDGRGGHPIVGAIRVAYDRTAGRLALGAPLGPEVPTADGVGRWQEFVGGGILWHPAHTGDVAYAMGRGILEAFHGAGAETVLGWPGGDEWPTPDGAGRFVHFTGSAATGGMPASVYWHPWAGAHVVQGLIRRRWSELGWETGLGYPITDEFTCPDGVGRGNHFSGRKNDTGKTSLYWTPATGPRAIVGAIRDAWAAQGWETGPLGYPIDEEHPAEGGIVQTFERGTILAKGGTTTVRRQ